VTYNALIVGLGQIGMGYDLEFDPQERIATLARAFASHHAFNLIGGVDTSAGRRELFVAHYAKPAFSNVAKAFEVAVPEVVAIAVPTEAHYSVVVDLLARPGIKVILCEKPLSYDLAEAEEMVELASRADVRLYTNYMRRSDRAVIEVRRRLLSGEIAGPVKGVCWYTKGLFNNGSHFLNLLQFWLGDVVSFDVISKGRFWANYDPEPDLKIAFEYGEVYFHVAPEENFSHHSVELLAANGRLRYEQGLMQWQPTITDKNHVGYTILNLDRETIESDTLFLQTSVVDKIARDFAGEVTTICTGAQGLSTIKVLTEIRKRL